MGPKTWGELNRDEAPVVVPYVVTSEDVAGPFEKVPAETAEQAKLSALGFESSIEALGERFHASPRLLRALNPGAAFDAAGVEIRVPNVERPPLTKTHGLSLRVSETDRSVVALGPDGSVMARYPATVGSEHDPLPIGEWKVNGVELEPELHLQPRSLLGFRAGRREGQAAARAEQPRRRGLDRPVEAALRDPRLA